MARATTSTFVRLNAKLESVNLRKVPAPANGTTITEGYFIQCDSNGKATLCDGTVAAGSVAFIVFQGNGRADTADSQNSPMAELDPNQTITLETGGITAIVGNGCEIGLPVTFIASGSSAVVGDLITSSSLGVPTRVAAPTNVVIATAVIDTRAFGVVTQVKDGIVWFVFNSFAQLLNLA